MRRMKYLAAIVCAAILYGQAASPAEETLWVTANGLRLKTQIYRSSWQASGKSSYTHHLISTG